MNSMTRTAPRTCPDWCDYRATNHLSDINEDGWDGFGVDDTGAEYGSRTHSKDIGTGDGWGVAISALEVEGKGLVEGPRVWIDSAPDGAMLDADEAVKLAAAILDAAKVLQEIGQ